MTLGKHNIIRVLVFLVLAMAIATTLWHSQALNTETISRWFNSFGAYTWLAFMLFYALGTLLFFPGSLLTLAGGALFGPVLGTFYNLTSATIGATLAFLVARHLASDWVEAKARPRLNQLTAGVEHEGWRFIAFTRLVPLFPFSLLNYALGLTRIKLSHYIITTYICMLPGAIAYTYLGYTAHTAIGGHEDLIQNAMTALALLAIVAFLPRLVKHFKKAPLINVASLHDQLQSTRLRLLDVRNQQDFQGERGSITNALNIPLEALESRTDELGNDLTTPIALICTTDRRSQIAARILTGKGFSQVWVVGGGMTDWNKAKYPVERFDNYV